MTLEQKIIFSSTLVAVLAGLAGVMLYKYSQPLEDKCNAAMMDWEKEMAAANEVKLSFLELRNTIVRSSLSLHSEAKNTSPADEDYKQDFYSQVEDLKSNIKAYSTMGESPSALRTELLEITYPIINTSAAIPYPLQGSSAEIRKALVNLEDIEQRLFIALEESSQRTLVATQITERGVMSEVKQMFRWVMITSLCVFLLAIVFGQLIARDLSHAISSLKAAATQIEKGNYTPRLPLHRKDEFGALAGSFNHLAEDLQKTKIIEQQNEQLELLNIELKKKNDSLDSFIYRVSHDLKAPVINIKSLLKVIMQQTEGNNNPVLAKTTSFMDKTADKLQQTIVDLLEVSRIESHLNGEKERINLQEILEEVIVENSQVIDQTGTTITHDFDGDLQVYFSSVNMKSILANILTNCIKYRSPDRLPKVEINSKVQGDYVMLCIKDNGIGIDLKRHKEKLFGMFNRFHNHVEGSGVGLYIVKKLVAEGGGKLEIESEVGKGTSIKLYFQQEPKTAEINTLISV